jgi:hypothetical protein
MLNLTSPFIVFINLPHPDLQVILIKLITLYIIVRWHAKAKLGLCLGTTPKYVWTNGNTLHALLASALGGGVRLTLRDALDRSHCGCDSEEKNPYICQESNHGHTARSQLLY